MKKQSDITMSEWKQELENLRPHDEGKTLYEIADFLNLSYTQTERILNNGIKSGKYIKGKAFINSRLCNVYKINKKGK